MANPTSQVPQHVTALLSHLSSRPGVQSTFILSRKDGSIIQSTGLYASNLTTGNHAANATASTSDLEPVEAGPDHKHAHTQSSSSNTTTTTQPESSTSSSDAASASPAHPRTQTPYQPTQAEALAAQIYAFVSSASALSSALTQPPSSSSQAATGNGYSKSELNGLEEYVNSRTPREEDGDGEGSGNNIQEDDEVKLLRLRTKKHEIVVVPDRKYLLCVVHGTTSTSTSGSSGSSR
ncbi:hypothetical protein MAP00_006635 [Monascus purpureus]|nr:hypothetical protein MAP00_006635 [Monascus purpureus]